MNTFSVKPNSAVATATGDSHVSGDLLTLNATSLLVYGREPSWVSGVIFGPETKPFQLPLTQAFG
jgi:hypothetical protein